MASDDSAMDPKVVARVRRLLASPEAPRERMWPALAAATLFAVSALSFAVAMVIAPPLTTQHMAADRSTAIR
jgi:hypothetical protein